MRNRYYFVFKGKDGVKYLDLISGLSAKEATTKFNQLHPNCKIVSIKNIGNGCD